MKHILVDIRHLSNQNPAGVGGYTIDLLRALFQIDTQNKYTLLSSGTQELDLENLGLNAPQCSHVHIKTPNKLLNLRSLLFKKPPITSYVDQPVDLIFLPNLNIVNLPKDTPVVITSHDISWHLYPNFFSHKMRLWHKATKPKDLFDRAQAIITPSNSTKQDLEEEFEIAKEKITAIPHGSDEAFSARMKASDHGVRSRNKLPKHFALFVGTHEPRKNILALIDGVKRYREHTNDNLHLLLIGSWGWKSRPIKRRLWKADVKSWVRKLGYAKKSDLPAIYRSAAVTIFPSIYEGFGLPVLESMASGTPVITSHTSSMPEVGGDAAIYIDPYNSQDISDALRGLLGSSSLEQQCKERGIIRAKTFSWKDSAKQTLRVFTDLLDQ
jgi:glycosyltransferase involved in cell wall biosynthesis